MIYLNRRPWQIHIIKFYRIILCQIKYGPNPHWVCPVCGPYTCNPAQILYWAMDGLIQPNPYMIVCVWLGQCPLHGYYSSMSPYTLEMACLSLWKESPST